MAQGAQEPSTALRKHCDLLFTGSIPLQNAHEVFSTLGTRFGGHLRRYPDGETGVRTNWVLYQHHVFQNNPAFELVESEPDWRSATVAKGQRLDTHYRLREGVTPESVSFSNLGYADPAIESYGVFHALKDAGVIPSGARFMVAIPSPFNVMSWGIVPHQRLAVEAPYEAAMKREIERMSAAIPHDEFAIQWDVARDMHAYEGARDAYFSPAKQGVINRLVKVGDWVPGGVELAYHLCYGSYGGKHFIEPKDMGAMVEVANGIVEGIKHKIDWIHMPVPIERDDDAYFAPLADLHTDKSTDIYLGLIHEADGVEGSRRKIEAAERYLPEFGIATECGFGRMPVEQAQRILAAHTKLLDAFC